MLFASICANAFSIAVIWLVCFFWPFFFSSFLYGKFFFFVTVRAMPWVAAALATRFVISCFFQLVGFVISISSYRPAHLHAFKIPNAITQITINAVISRSWPGNHLTLIFSLFFLLAIRTLA